MRSRAPELEQIQSWKSKHKLRRHREVRRRRRAVNFRQHEPPQLMQSKACSARLSPLRPRGWRRCVFCYLARGCWFGCCVPSVLGFCLPRHRPQKVCGLGLGFRPRTLGYCIRCEVRGIRSCAILKPWCAFPCSAPLHLLVPSLSHSLTIGTCKLINVTVRYATPAKERRMMMTTTTMI